MWGGKVAGICGLVLFAMGIVLFATGAHDFTDPFAWLVSPLLLLAGGSMVLGSALHRMLVGPRQSSPEKGQGEDEQSRPRRLKRIA